jgi:hypothetical protein
MALRLATPKRHKYGAQRTTVDGETFDSKGEAQRWCELRLLEKAGKIRGLLRQYSFPFVVNGKLVGHFTADFAYQEPLDGGGWVNIVEDFKAAPTRTEAYQLRKRLTLALYGIEIRETGKAPKAGRRGR